MERAPGIVRSVEAKLEPIRTRSRRCRTRSKATTSPKPAQPVVAPPPPSASSAVDSTRIVASLALFAPGVLAQLFYVTTMTIFLLAFRAGYSEQLVLLPHSYAQRLHMARIIDVRMRVSRLSVHAGDHQCLPCSSRHGCTHHRRNFGFAFVGHRHGLLNFVPIIGPTTCIVAATAVGMATADHLHRGAGVAGDPVGHPAVRSNFVQPWLVARRLVVSPIAVFAMVATLCLDVGGVFAAITAVPILILLHTVMMHVPVAAAFAGLLATEHATHPHHAHFVKHKHHHHAWLRRKTAEARKTKRLSVLRLTPHHRPPQALHAIQRSSQWAGPPLSVDQSEPRHAGKVLAQHRALVKPHLGEGIDQRLLQQGA